MNDDMQTCYDCHEESETNDMRDTYCGHMVCESCADSEYIDIDDRGLVHMESVVECCETGTVYHCDDTSPCIGCGDPIGHGNANWRTYDDEPLCTSCMEYGEYRIPADSDYIFHIDSLYWCESQEEYFQDESNVNANGDWHPYNANVLDHVGYNALVIQSGKGATVPLNNATKMDLFGIELEMDARYGMDDIHAAWSNTELSQYSILKDDGSISGLELVTMPATLGAHIRAMDYDGFCQAMRPQARGHHGRGNGIHIHANRRTISTLTLGKILVFNNREDNAPFLQMIAQRDINAHVSWCAIKPESYDTVGKSGKEPNTTGKYSIVNVLPNTVEFRMFNASLLPERIHKNVEFVAAMIAWCRVASARQLWISEFLQFVHANRAMYPNLNKFISERLNAQGNAELQNAA
jgi:hypothetical protein